MDKQFSSVILSSRARLARNLADTPFPGRQNAQQAQDTIERVASAIAKSSMTNDFAFYRLANEDETTCLSMVEGHLISPDLLKHKNRGAVFLNKARTLSIMVGEEDHLRIQSILPGFELKEALTMANQADDAICGRETYAFSDEIGYLTACPTNVGTGLRASLMLHLPALTMAKQIESISQALGRVGLTVRGYYGEGSQAHGGLYQLSNQVTLGLDEQEILKNLETTAVQVIERELQARRFIHDHNRIELEDRLMRSYGVLHYAKKLTSAELLQMWSDVRFAHSLGMLPKIDPKALDGLLDLQPAHLTRKAGHDMTPQERDVYRAQCVKELIKEESN